jgi:D-sedoheptulose 7-phosphate isomerase
MSKSRRRLRQPPLPSRADPPADPETISREHLGRLRACLDAVDPARIAAVAAHLGGVVRAGGLILTAGNGGSATTASHMALDLGKSTLGRPPDRALRRVRTVSLADPSAVLTAWANDEGYEGVFAEQVAALARPGDALVLLSVSGTSPNVLAAARTARAKGASVIALVGAHPGPLGALADFTVSVPSDDYGIVEDVHLAINHILTKCLRDALHSPAPAKASRSRRPRPLARTTVERTPSGR